MPSFKDIMTALKPVESELLQVIEYTDAFKHLKCVIVFDKDPGDYLSLLQPLRAFCSKHKLPYPLVINRYFLESSHDSYPLELIDFSHAYTNIFCKEDLMAKLKFSPSDVRLQIERELKSKWLLTRMAILEGKPSETVIASIISSSIHAIATLLKGFHFLAKRNIPIDFAFLLKGCSEITGLDLNLISTGLQVKKASLFFALEYLALLDELILKLEIVAHDQN